ncbi:MAG TPA: GlsB/YeaQ/YmgE family stress response membrane protein [Aggregatilineales bacterium]|nr:GlsB/YeaQ/YmgE family stress response membrane protein [Aggregatilineales bacterium]
MALARFILSPITCILWLIVGAFAGGLAHRFVGGRSGGFVSDFILGVIGSIVGGFLLSLLGVDIQAGGSFLNPLFCLEYVIVSTIGASVLIVVGRAILGSRV